MKARKEWFYAYFPYYGLRMFYDRDAAEKTAMRWLLEEKDEGSVKAQETAADVEWGRATLIPLACGTAKFMLESVLPQPIEVPEPSPPPEPIKHFELKLDAAGAVVVNEIGKKEDD